MKLDKNKPYGETYGIPGVRYTQGGRDFAPNGDLIGDEPEPDLDKPEPTVVTDEPEPIIEEESKQPRYNLMGMMKLKQHMTRLGQEFTDVDSAKTWLMENG